MLCEFASGARGTFEASRTIVGPESQMAFDVYGTRGALSWNLERMNELQVYLAEDELHTGYRTVFGGERFPYHGHFVPGSANGIGFEDLVVIEDFEFCARLPRAGRTGRGSRTRSRGCACRRRCWSRAGAGPGRTSSGGRTVEPRATATVRVGVIGVGRIGRMHAELLARRVPGAARAGDLRRARRNRSRPRRASSAYRSRPRSTSCSRAPTSTRSRSAPATDTHADLIVAAAQAGKAIFCEKPVSLDLAEVDRALAAVDEAGVPFQIGFNRRFDPAHAVRARRGRRRRGRRPAARANHQPRPRAAAAGVRARRRAGSSST